MSSDQEMTVIVVLGTIWVLVWVVEILWAVKKAWERRKPKIKS